MSAHQRSYVNSRTLRFQPQTQKLEPLWYSTIDQGKNRLQWSHNRNSFTDSKVRTILFSKTYKSKYRSIGKLFFFFPEGLSHCSQSIRSKLKIYLMQNDVRRLIISVARAEQKCLFLDIK